MQISSDFAKKCTKALIRAKQAKKFHVHGIWVVNPIQFAEHMLKQPGAELAVKLNLSVRRLNQEFGFMPGNVRWHDQERKHIFKTPESVAEYARKVDSHVG